MEIFPEKESNGSKSGVRKIISTISGFLSNTISHPSRDIYKKLSSKEKASEVRNNTDISELTDHINEPYINENSILQSDQNINYKDSNFILNTLRKNYLLSLITILLAGFPSIIFLFSEASTLLNSGSFMYYYPKSFQNILLKLHQFSNFSYLIFSFSLSYIVLKLFYRFSQTLHIKYSDNFLIELGNNGHLCHIHIEFDSFEDISTFMTQSRDYLDKLYCTIEFIKTQKVKKIKLFQNVEYIVISSHLIGKEDSKGNKKFSYIGNNIIKKYNVSSENTKIIHGTPFIRKVALLIKLRSFSKLNSLLKKRHTGEIKIPI